MASANRIAANRINARASTGPKTATGKTRSARNAYRHGLSISVLKDPVFCEQVEEFAKQLANPGDSAEIQILARQVAEAQIDLVRIRQARDCAVSLAFADPYYAPSSSQLGLKELQWLVKNIGTLADPPLKISRALEWPYAGDKKLTTIFIDLNKRLVALSRYERRTLSRRKFAVRELDAARKIAMKQGSMDRAAA